MKNLIKLICLNILIVFSIMFFIGTNANIKKLSALSGTGTKLDPYRVSTFKDLSDALKHDNAYIVVENFESGNLDSCGYYTPKEDEISDQSTSCLTFYTRFTIHLTINCDIKIKQPDYFPRLNALFGGGGVYEDVKANIYLDGTGTICFKPNPNGYNYGSVTALKIVSDTNCTIDGDLIFTTDLSNKKGECGDGLTTSSRDNIVINGGTFIAQNNNTYSAGHGFVCSLYDNSVVTINGGKFLVSENSVSTCPACGLQIISKDSSQANNINIYGGEFDGIMCRDKSFDVNSCLADGYEFVLKDDSKVADGICQVQAYMLAREIVINTYNVSFNANGGTGDMASTVVNEGEYILPDCEFTNDNGSLVFRGWMLSPDDDELYDAGDVIIIDSDTTFYASWSEKDIYVITYDDAHGHTFSYYALEGSQISVWSFEECGFKAPVGERFTIWDSKWSDPRIDVEPNTKYTVPDDNVYFMAKYEETGQKVCIIDFNSSGGSGEMESVKVLAGTFYTLPANTEFSNGGAPFRYWDVGTYGYLNPYDSFFVRENTSISAVWGEPVAIEVYHRTGYVLDNHGAGYQDIVAYLVYEDGTRDEIDPHYDLEISILTDELNYELVDLKNFKPIETKKFHFKARYLDNVGLETEFDINFGDYRLMKFNLDMNGDEYFNLYWLNGQTYQFPSYPKEVADGLKFNGWIDFYGAKYEINDNYSVTESVVFYPSISGASYNISFDPGLGTGAMDGKTSYYNTNFYLPKPSFTAPDGYIFDYWLINGNIYQANIMYNYEWTNDVIATAKYREKAATTYIVNYDSNGSDDNIKASYVAENHNYSLPSESALTPPNGKILDYWEVTIGQADPINKAPGEGVIITDNTLIKAIWKDKPIIKHTITYQANGGTGSDYVLEDLEEGSTHTLVAFATTGFEAPAGKEFDCWKFNDASLNPGEDIRVEADITILAQWKDQDINPQPTYTITFNPNAGTGTMTQVNDANGDYTLPVSTFIAPDGKEFAGWKINGEGDTLAPNTHINVTTDIELVAQWKNIEDEPTNPGEPTTPETPDTPTNPTTPKKGMSAGAVVAIVIGSILILGIGGFAIVWFVIKKKTWADFLALFKK